MFQYGMTLLGMNRLLRRVSYCHSNYGCVRKLSSVVVRQLVISSPCLERVNAMLSYNEVGSIPTTTAKLGFCGNRIEWCVSTSLVKL